jgi:ketosteroid isomerase-like protein
MKKMFLLAFCAFTVMAYAADPKIDKEIQGAMETWKQAMLTRDKAAFEKLYATDLTYTHSNGRHETKTEAIEAVVSGKNKYDSIDIADLKVYPYGTTALAKCKVTMKMTTDGASSTVILDILHVFVKISGKWQLVGRQATRLNP